jgi:hypothetical protein
MGLAKQLGHLYRFVMRTSFARMSPAQSLVDGDNLCLAQPGVEYVVYAPAGGAVTIDLADVAGKFEAEWLNPRTGEYLPAAAAPGGARRTFRCPDSADWTFYIRAKR